MLNGSDPIVDIIIIPCPAAVSTAYVPFANSRDHHNLSPSEPTKIIKVTFYGSSCSYEIIHESTALAPFLKSQSTLNLTLRDLDNAMLA